MKKAIALLLTIMLIFCAVPLSAAADTTVSDQDSLVTAAANGGEITISQDISLTATVNVTADLVINLNGYMIQSYYGGNVFDSLFCVTDANLTINSQAGNSGALHYYGDGSAIQLAGTASLTVNNSNLLAHNSYDNNVGGFVYPTALFLSESAASTISLNKGSYICDRLDTNINAPTSDGALLSGNAALSIINGSFCADPQAYLADGSIAFCDDVGDWVVAYVAGEFSEDFKTILNQNNELVLKRITPDENTFDTFIDSLKMQYTYGEDVVIPFDFYPSTYDEESSTMVVVMLDESFSDVETHIVDLVFVYDPETKAEIDTIMASLPADTEDGPYEYKVDDLALINYYMTCSEDNYSMNLPLLNYSEEFKQHIGYKNFRITIGAGDGDWFYDSCYGYADIMLGDTIYATKEMGAKAERILYVPDDTADTPDAKLSAAQSRIDDYLGEGVVTLEYVATVSEALFGGEDTSEVDFEAECNIPGLLGTDHCVMTVINGLEYMFVIKNNSAKISTPTFKNVDFGTEISVDTADSSVPLDTMLEVEKLTEGEEYNNIVNVLSVEENETFDIKLFSGSTENYVTNSQNESFKVSIPVPASLEGKSLIAYYVDENNNVTSYPVTLTEQEDYACFETDHFSIYTLAEATEQSEPQEIIIDTITTIAEGENKTIEVAIDGTYASLSGLCVNFGDTAVTEYTESDGKLIFSHTSTQAQLSISISADNAASKAVVCQLERYTSGKFTQYINTTLGDANADGITDIKDLVRLKKVIAETVAAGEIADLNCDNSLTVEDLTLIARLIISEKSGIAVHTVTFKNDDGSTLKALIVPDGFGANPKLIPQKDGYAFAGWDKAFSSITDDTIITATYQQNSGGSIDGSVDEDWEYGD